MSSCPIPSLRRPQTLNLLLAAKSDNREASDGPGWRGPSIERLAHARFETGGTHEMGAAAGEWWWLVEARGLVVGRGGRTGAGRAGSLLPGGGREATGR